jgi:hypothetical protein
MYICGGTSNLRVLSLFLCHRDSSVPLDQAVVSSAVVYQKRADTKKILYSIQQEPRMYEG